MYTRCLSFDPKVDLFLDTFTKIASFFLDKKSEAQYRLYGVSNHSGGTYSGHYTAYCKHPESGEWHHYSDA